LSSALTPSQMFDGTPLLPHLACAIRRIRN
jgi:hypothetical protein